MAIQEIEDILAATAAAGGGSVWGQLTENCKDDIVLQAFLSPVEECISKYIAGLEDGDKRAIWEETETGRMSSAGAERWDIGCLEMDLETELLQELLESAFRQAEERRREPCQKRTRKSRGKASPAEMCDVGGTRKGEILSKRVEAKSIKDFIVQANPDSTVVITPKFRSADSSISLQSWDKEEGLTHFHVVTIPNANRQTIEKRVQQVEKRLTKSGFAVAQASMIE